MNPIVLLFLISILAKARTRRDRLKAIMVILTVLAQQQGRVNLAHMRRMARNASDDSLLVHLIAALREEPTGVNDPHNSDMMRRIKKGTEIQFRRMFRVSRLVFEAVLAELSPFLNNGASRNSQQNTPASLKLGVALYFMAHGGDAIHLEAASGLSKSTALKYVHEVAELICTHLTKKWMGKALLEEDGYNKSLIEEFCHHIPFRYC